MSEVTALRRKPVPEVIAGCERLLELAKSGELQAMCVLGDGSDGNSTWTAGDMPLHSALKAFEHWKLRHMLADYGVPTREGDRG